MNVLVAVPWDQDSGGVASVVGHLARHLESNGHRVYFLHPSRTYSLRARRTKWGFNGFTMPLLPPRDPSGTLKSRLAFLLLFMPTLVRVWRLLRRHQIDIVNIHYPSAAFGYLTVAKLRSTRLVISIHGTDLLPAAGQPPSADLLTKVLLRRADAIVSPSDGFARQCMAVLPKNTTRVWTIPNGIDAQEFALLRRDDAGLPTVLSIASLDHWKGLDVLLRAMRVVKQHVPSVRLRIAGTGPELDALTRLRDELDLGDSVEFLGYQSRAAVVQLLSTCTLFALPSRSEPFGLVLLEAQAAGAPVIATRVGGIPEVVEENGTALLVDPDDVDGLAQATIRLLNDAALRRQLGLRGGQRVNDRFSWDVTGRRYLSLFSLLQDRRATR